MSSIPESHYAAHKQPRRQKREHPGKARVAVKQKLSAFTDIGCLVSCYKARITENGGVNAVVYGEAMEFSPLEYAVLAYEHICRNIDYYRLNRDALPLPVRKKLPAVNLRGKAAYLWIAKQIGSVESYDVEAHLQSAYRKLGSRTMLGLE